MSGKKAWVYTGKFVSDNGAAEGSYGGKRAIKAVPLVVPIHDVAVLTGSLDVFEILESYMQVRQSPNISTNRSLLDARAERTGTDLSTFFTNQSLARNTFGKILSDTRKALNILGDGPNQKLKMRVLRASIITILKEAGFSDSSFALCISHRDLNDVHK